ncbi:amino acid kinase family protein [Candidatus Vidania fulgoroideorum]
MKIEIHKYGGTSLGTIQRIKNCITKLTVNTPSKTIIIVSAIYGYTNQLIKLFEKTHYTINSTEADTIITLGEVLTAALVTAIIKRTTGLTTIFRTAWQIPIITHTPIHHINSIKYINKKSLTQDIKNNTITIICGFQGINNHRSLTKLDRGGSDTTALAITHTLRHHTCQLYKDVQGIHPLDPNKHKNTKNYKHVNYKTLIELASLGSRIININTLYIAFKKNIILALKYSFENYNNNNIYTYISHTHTMVKLIHSSNTLLITIKTNIYTFLKLINRKNITLNFIKLTNNTLKILINKAETYQLNKHLLHAKIQKVVCISIIGIGLHNCKKYSYNILKTLNKNNINIYEVNIAENIIKIITHRKLEVKTIKIIRKITKI